MIPGLGRSSGDGIPVLLPGEFHGPNMNTKEFRLLLCMQYDRVGIPRSETERDVGELSGDVPVAPEY